MVEKQERDPLTERIIGCCFAIHNELGMGFKEKVYQNALQLALEREGLKCNIEQAFNVCYQDKLVGTYRADMVVDDNVIVEIKAISGPMAKIFETQLLSYLRVSKIHVGLLVNFGNRKCQIKRLVV